MSRSIEKARQAYPWADASTVEGVIRSRGESIPRVMVARDIARTPLSDQLLSSMNQAAAAELSGAANCTERALRTLFDQAGRLHRHEVTLHVGDSALDHDWVMTYDTRSRANSHQVAGDALHGGAPMLVSDTRLKDSAAMKVEFSIDHAHGKSTAEDYHQHKRELEREYSPQRIERLLEAKRKELDPLPDGMPERPDPRPTLADPAFAREAKQAVDAMGAKQREEQAFEAALDAGMSIAQAKTFQHWIIHGARTLDTTLPDEAAELPAKPV